jgi:uncharacterized protein YkwD
MKMLPIVALFFGAISPLCAQNSDASKLSAIIRNASVDSTEKTERLAAIYFHQEINQYRVAQKKTPLGWDDTLWLAARNHCNWMKENDKLSHEENAGTKAFNGQSPADRYDFASKGKGKCSWSGENILYQWAFSYSTIQEYARDIANQAFELWKSSPGHNENMLNDASRIHGVAFRFATDGKIWTTDLFCYSPSYSLIVENPASLGMNGNTEYVAVNTDTSRAEFIPNIGAETKPDAEKNKFVSASAKYIRLDLVETSSDLQNALYSSSTLHHSKSMARAAQHHAEYMGSVSKLTHSENKKKKKYYAGSPQQRIAKASRGTKMFHKKSTHYVESIAFVTADAAALNISELSKTILAALDKERTKVAGTTTSVGFGVMIKRLKNELKIYVVRDERVSEKTKRKSESSDTSVDF